jgi:hypothetical protein
MSQAGVEMRGRTSEPPCPKVRIPNASQQLNETAARTQAELSAGRILAIKFRPELAVFRTRSLTELRSS